MRASVHVCAMYAQARRVMRQIHCEYGCLSVGREIKLHEHKMIMWRREELGERSALGYSSPSISNQITSNLRRLHRVGSDLRPVDAARKGGISALDEVV